MRTSNDEQATVVIGITASQGAIQRSQSKTGVVQRKGNKTGEGVVDNELPELVLPSPLLYGGGGSSMMSGSSAEGSRVNNGEGEEERKRREEEDEEKKREEEETERLLTIPVRVLRNKPRGCCGGQKRKKKQYLTSGIKFGMN